ncbi:hypothetical protein Q5P01_009484 [Channa striata]|uniref:G-protein coupled receptors family 1 profile domain-containing protein n=1 Tax=Channa striata TaxID=64152 RepID=A0AA88N0J0_CHASR|nr:hypothetical protein Q5P01_009484 [Channa striata]
MVNSTRVSYITLAAYFDTGILKYLWFVTVICLYILIVFSDVLLVVVICLFPFLMVQILSDTHIVSTDFCYLQIFHVYSYAHTEFCNLAAMSYDRYLAICYPLQYHTLGVSLSMTARLQLCGDSLNKVYCDNYSAVKLACYDTTVNNVFGIVYIFTILFGFIILILYTYMKILQVCFSGSKQTRQKAVSTCTPHLLSLLNFSFGSFFEMMQSRFNLNNLPNMLRILLSLYCITCQPLFTPVLYGLQMSKIRSLCKSLIFGNL